MQLAQLGCVLTALTCTHAGVHEGVQEGTQPALRGQVPRWRGHLRAPLRQAGGGAQALLLLHALNGGCSLSPWRHRLALMFDA